MYSTKGDDLGSTSVGIVSIQMLKAKNCRVVTSCSTKNVEFVKQLGADEVGGHCFCRLEIIGFQWAAKILGTGLHFESIA
jgi:D-arabinose 1-dehydrogenase-like Zn-dependent alcohol dehydrogenase